MVDYNKVGLLHIRDGRILLCRKSRGTSLLIVPGGCVEPGETSIECLTREIREELGDQVRVTEPQFLGVYEHAAADAGKTLRMELYRGGLAGEPRASAEIAELVWFGAGDDESKLSPSLRERILPDLRARGVVTFT